MSYKQFDVYWVDLNPAKGSETKKNRPCVIIQSTLLNKNSHTLLVAPLLPEHKNWPFVVNIEPSKTNGIDKNRHINLKQMRAVDVSRLSKKQGVIEPGYVQQLWDSLQLIFDM